jgi:phasin family protein
MAPDPKASDFDFTRMFAEMKLPAAADLEAFTSAIRRNIEAITAANRIALEGAQSVARRHMEIMQQAMTEMSEVVRTLTGTEAPQAKAARQAELLKQAYERAVANIRELRDLIHKSNEEALTLLNKRFSEAMDEIKAIAEKAK